jgi:type II secretory pathway pseudopilin PulG
MKIGKLNAADFDAVKKEEAEVSKNGLFGRRSRRGYSIVEIGLVLIVVALLIATIIVAFYQVQTNAKQTQVTNLVNETYQSVQDLYRTASSYGPNGTNLIPVMEAAQALPAIGRRDLDGNPDSGDETLVTSFGEPVTVEAGGLVGAAGETFTVNMTNFTRANCMDFLANYVDRSQNQTGLVSVQSNGTAIASPITIADLTTNCADGDLELEFR